MRTRHGSRWRSPRPRWLVVAAAAAATTAASCVGQRRASKAPEGPEGADKLGAGEGEVNLIAWAGYVEDGSTDPKVDWVSDFEKETGCQVNVKVGNTSDEMVTLMRTGQYDGVSASGDATLRLIAGGDVAPGQHRPGPELRRRLRRASRTSRGTRSTARRTASRTAAARTC